MEIIAKHLDALDPTTKYTKYTKTGEIGKFGAFSGFVTLWSFRVDCAAGVFVVARSANSTR